MGMKSEEITFSFFFDRVREKQRNRKLKALGFLIMRRDAGYYTLISTSTPLGSSSFIRASTVFAVEL
jgi:hypothetical protein